MYSRIEGLCNNKYSCSAADKRITNSRDCRRRKEQGGRSHLRTSSIRLPLHGAGRSLSRIGFARPKDQSTNGCSTGGPWTASNRLVEKVSEGSRDSLIFKFSNPVWKWTWKWKSSKGISEWGCCQRWLTRQPNSLFPFLTP